MSKPYLIFAGLLFVLLILHASPWVYFTDGETIPARLFDVNGGHYLTLEAEVWTCVLIGLTVAFLGEGVFRGCCRSDRTAAVR